MLYSLCALILCTARFKHVAKTVGIHYFKRKGDGVMNRDRANLEVAKDMLRLQEKYDGLPFIIVPAQIFMDKEIDMIAAFEYIKILFNVYIKRDRRIRYVRTKQLQRTGWLIKKTTSIGKELYPSFFKLYSNDQLKKTMPRRIKRIKEDTDE